MYKYISEIEKLLDEIIKNNNFNKKSVPFYKGKVNKFFKEYMSMPENENKPLDALSYFDINTYLYSLKYGDADKLNHYQALKSFFTYTYYKGLTKDLISQVTKPIYKRPAKVIMGEDSYSKLVEFISDRDNIIMDRLTLGLFLYTGLSRKYIHQLRNNQFIYEGGIYKLLLWKGDKEFIIPIKTELQIIVHEYIINLPCEELRNKVLDYDENYLTKLIKDICRKGCGKVFTPTILSNTFISKALSDGNYIWEVSMLTLESVSTIEEHVKNTNGLIYKQSSILSSF